MPRREQVTERLSAREGKHGTCLSAADALPERLDQVISEQAALGEALASFSEELHKLVKCLEEMSGWVEALDTKVVTTQSCMLKHAALMRELALGSLETEHRAGEQGVGPERRGHWGSSHCGRHRPDPFLGKPGAGSPGLKCEGSSYAYRNPATHARQQRLVVLKQAFVKEGVQTYVLYPAKLKVLCRGQTYVFRDCASAARLLDEIRQVERLTMALIRNRLGLLVLGVLVTFVLYLLLPAIQHERFTSRAGSHKAQARAEEKGQRDVNVTVLTGTIAGSPLEVIFLHGQAFTSKTWEDLGTLTLLSEEGYRSIAIDLPGYGNSPPSDAVSTEQGRVAFLQHVLKELGIQRPVLISPSMSGRYSIPFVLVHGTQLKGFVPIAPVGTQDYMSQQYQQVQTPTLIIYGERDTGLGAQSLQSLQQLPKHKVVALPDAGHACYLEKPREFHEALLAFLGELQ
ncbi:hypothetical protein KIL84_003052 [Mauremys mutica]|uniref:Protein ABHD14A n=1 Tax=Mauremys mutica TaxID=74926 RepID=A0A9D3WT46_9SAUR|nr:hypothetical protein KIL84_003052 [Mauremys mutica]